MSKRHDLKRFDNVTELLTSVELEDTARKEQMFNRLKFKIETGAIQPNMIKKDDLYMKHKKWKSVAVGALAVICAGGIFSTTSYAHDMLGSIMARFQVGNMQITQYKELPQADVKTSESQPTTNESRTVQQAPKKMTLQEARTSLGVDFPVPAWMADYTFVNCVVHGDKMIEVQYERNGDIISLLISTGGSNGIGTQDEVKKETIAGTTVYFANGIVIWEYKGFTYEMYQMAKEDLDTQALTKVISSITTNK